MTTKKTEGAAPGPAWVKELQAKYSSGVSHAFILHFDVTGYAVPGVRMRNYLAKVLSSRKIVVFYNRADGIQFISDDMKKEFISVLGLDQQPANPAYAALAAVQGMPQPKPGEPELPKAPLAALPLLVKLLKMGGPDENLAAVIVESAETIVPDAPLAMMSPEDRTTLVMLEEIGRDPEIEASGNPIILLARNLADLHQMIRASSSKYEAIAVPLPDRQARLAAIDKYTEANPELQVEIEPDQMANRTAGLGLIQIEDIFLRAASQGAVTQELVTQRKADIISSEFEVMRLREPRFGFDSIGGMENVKRALRRCILDPIKAGKLNRVAMGVILSGPAGVGKTAIIEALAYELGFNCVELDFSRILGPYVGNSERALDRFLYAVVTLSPLLVIIDEADQALRRGTGGGDSGVSDRVFQKIMAFMSDTSHRGLVVFAAMSNRPDLMDAALRRPGRFDKHIPCLMPDAEEREAIFAVKCRQYGLDLTAISPEVVAQTEGFTGAEIELVVVKALEVMDYGGLSPEDALRGASVSIRASTADVEYMTAIAIQECNDRDLLPKRYWPLFDDRAGLKKRIKETAPVERGRRGEL
jgi:ATP-dependent 26S proteasome regulatory subunit